MNQQLLYFFKWQHLNWVPIFSGSCHHLLKPKAGWNEKYCYNSAHTLISCGVTDFILRFLDSYELPKLVLILRPVWAPGHIRDPKLVSRNGLLKLSVISTFEDQKIIQGHLRRKDHNLKKARLTPYFDQLVCTTAGKPFSIGGELHTWHRLKKD